MRGNTKSATLFSGPRRSMDKLSYKGTEFLTRVGAREVCPRRKQYVDEARRLPLREDSCNNRVVTALLTALLSQGLVL